MPPRADQPPGPGTIQRLRLARGEKFDTQHPSSSTSPPSPGSSPIPRPRPRFCTSSRSNSSESRELVDLTIGGASAPTERASTSSASGVQALCSAWLQRRHRLQQGQSAPRLWATRHRARKRGCCSISRDAARATAAKRRAHAFRACPHRALQHAPLVALPQPSASELLHVPRRIGARAHPAVPGDLPRHATAARRHQRRLQWRVHPDRQHDGSGAKSCRCELAIGFGNVEVAPTNV